MPDTLVRAAAQARRAAFDTDTQGRGQRSDPSGGIIRPTPSARVEMRAEKVTKGGKDFLRLLGHASTYEQRYEMWDMWGPYSEGVRSGAGARTLAASPDVAFLINHTGLALARTKATTLELSEDAEGLVSDAYMNPQRQDAADLYQSVLDGSTCEMSFAFRIEDGEWSRDYDEYWITEYNIDRGDTSAVTYGANPHTDIAARSADFAAVLRRLDGPALRAAHDFLAERLGEGASRGTVTVDVVARTPDVAALVAGLSTDERAEAARLLAAPAEPAVAAAVADASAQLGATPVAKGMPLALATAVLAASE